MRAGGKASAMHRANVETNNKAGASRADIRRSYTSAIVPELTAEGDTVTQLVLRMFQSVRHLTGYDFGPWGQEPLSVNLYKDVGDEFRLHCDGPCMGEPYTVGERAATSLLYCRTAKRGGATSFMQDALKAVPRAGDLLVFTYRCDRAGATGAEGVHSACPLEKGVKWVATQRYREGVNRSYTAAAADQATRPLRRVGKPAWIS
mmetsp:Transcript_7619/g.27937  ORF Transcript_7619/g.27937 Transcript_7619/m.27937 type:complete len:204 (+) Transcript_7619:358-969(+)